MKCATGFFVAALAICLITCGFTTGAEPINKGDEVEVFFLNKWRPGVVVKSNVRGMVLVEFEFINKEKRAFRRKDVRLAYAAGALSRPRFWKDSSGKSIGRAVLVAIDEEEVTLRKRDMEEFNVSIASLSKTDQAFLKRMETRAAKEGKGLAGKDPVYNGPKPPPVEQFKMSGDIQLFALSMSNSEQGSALDPDPLPAYLKLKQGGVGFPADDYSDEIGAVLPIGGPESWLLAVVNSDKPGTPLPTRLVWASTARKKVAQRQLLPPGEIVLDYYPPGHQLLTASTVDSSGDFMSHGSGITEVLTLWEVLPTDSEVTPVVRWETPSRSSSRRYTWARLVRKNIVIQRVDQQKWLVWDAAAKRMLYRINQESFFAPNPVLSGGRKYLFLPEDKHVRVLESATGRVARVLPAPYGASGVAVSEDGSLAAVLDKNNLTIWDLTDPDAKPRVCQAEAIGTPFRATLNWVGQERLMANTSFGGLVLFSLPHKLVVWNYSFGSNTASASYGRRVKEVAAGHLTYAASLSQGGKNMLAVGAVRLPGPKVNEAIASIDKESMMVLKRGVAVRLEVNAGAYTERVRTALERKIKENGWILDPNASIVVAAKMYRGKTQQVTYRFHGRERPDQTVTVTPEISKIVIKVGKAVAWQNSTGSGAPPVIMLRKGESAQSEINKYQNPNVEFFDRVKIPSRILDPKKRLGLGSTQITTKGMIVVPDLNEMQKLLPKDFQGLR